MNTITAKQRAHYIHQIVKVLNESLSLTIEESAEMVFEKVLAQAIEDERSIWEKLLFVKEGDRAH